MAMPAGASAGGAAVNPNAAATAAAGPSLASASGGTIPGRLPLLLISSPKLSSLLIPVQLPLVCRDQQLCRYDNDAVNWLMKF